MHKYGQLNLDEGEPTYIGNSLLKSNLENIDRSRERVFFPLEVNKMDENSNAVLDGYAKDYGDIMEYDILFKFGNTSNVAEQYIFDSSSELSANIKSFSFFNGIGTNSENY